jgi:cyclic beta-1,2-glucan synthetase
MDGDAALLQRAREGVLALNARYLAAGRASPFYLLHRPRRWNPREGVWMGWERKRGKLEQFNAALRGELGPFATVVGDARHLRGVRYVIVLDSDTQLPRDAARELVGTMAHPLNRPRFDAALGRVVEGHAILQPRVAITMMSARPLGLRAPVRRRAGRIDPYTRAVSDLYQDVFGEGSFVGKGIYDVDAFQQALAGKLPENRVLSHDLLEGAYARAGLVSDVLLFEDYPTAYSVDVARRQRWTRGDWQLTAWLYGQVPGGAGGRMHNPISALSRWKIVDNLRRSLVPGALLALLLLGWTSPGLAGPATLVVLAILIVPGLLAAATALARRPDELPRRHHLRDIIDALALQLAREAFTLVCLPHDALVSAGAVLRANWRVRVSGRHLLEWRTASDAQRGASSGLGAAYQFMRGAPIVAVAAVATLCIVQPPRAAAGRTVRDRLAARAGAGMADEPTDPRRAALAHRRRRAVPAPGRASDLALLRGLRRPRRQSPAAGQLPGGPAAGHRASHLTDQHRPRADRQPRRIRLRLRPRGRAAAALRADDGGDGAYATPPRPLLQLVRHPHPRSAAPDLHLHRRQRQPGRAPAHARGRPP